MSNGEPIAIALQYAGEVATNLKNFPKRGHCLNVPLQCATFYNKHTTAGTGEYTC
jgi:hypothetical protein